MKRFVFCITICFAAVCCAGVRAYAADGDVYYSEAFGFDSLSDYISDDALSLLGEFGVSEFSADALLSVSFKRVFESLFGIFEGSLSEPLAAAAAVTGITLPLAAVGSSQKHKTVIDICAAALASLAVSVGVIKLVNDCFSVLTALSGFTAAFAGVFCAAVSASGGFASASAFAAVNVFYESFTNFICSALSQPLTNSMCSLAFLSSLNIYSFEQRLASLVKKIYMLFLGFSGAVFTGVFSLNGVLSRAADTAGMRGVKFLISHSVPIVGGVLGESCQSVAAALALIKNTVGVFGIITVALTVLPVSARLALWIFSLSLCAGAARFAGSEKTASALIIFKDALTLLAATVTFSAAVFIVCVGVVITFGGG